MRRRIQDRRDVRRGDKLEIHPVTPDRWEDLAALFVRKGPRGGTQPSDWCWCMWWRARSHDRDANRARMKALVQGRKEPGLLAYLDGEPVGWISVAPREQYSYLSRSTTLRPADTAERGVFSVMCFQVHPTAMRRGVGTALLAAAVEHARSRGATAIEGFPGPMLRGNSGQDFMGSKGMFERCGFEAVGRAGSRTIMRYRFGREARR